MAITGPILPLAAIPLVPKRGTAPEPGMGRLVRKARGLKPGRGFWVLPEKIALDSLHFRLRVALRGEGITTIERWPALWIYRPKED